MLAAARHPSRCPEITGPSRRGRLWVSFAALPNFCVAIFLHFVSFRISASAILLLSLRKVFPTGHLKRNGPWARNEMPSRNARGNRRRGCGELHIQTVNSRHGGERHFRAAIKAVVQVPGQLPSVVHLAVLPSHQTPRTILAAAGTLPVTRHAEPMRIHPPESSPRTRVATGGFGPG